MPPKRRLLTFDDRVAALDSTGEVEGFLAQIKLDGRQITDDQRGAIARRRIELQRAGK